MICRRPDIFSIFCSDCVRVCVICATFISIEQIWLKTLLNWQLMNSTIVECYGEASKWHNGHWDATQMINARSEHTRMTTIHILIFIQINVRFFSSYLFISLFWIVWVCMCVCVCVWHIFTTSDSMNWIHFFVWCVRWNGSSTTHKTQ